MRSTVRWFSVCVLVWVGAPLVAATPQQDLARLRRDAERVRMTVPQAAAAAHWCGTSAANTIEQERLAAWVEAKQRLRAAEAARLGIAADALPGVRYENGTFLMESDNTVAPHDRPIDLANSSLVFTRSGSGFTVQKTALDYDTVLGSETDMQGWQTKAEALPFQFPFFSSSYGNITIGTNNAIYFGSIPTSTNRQFLEIDLALSTYPVAAPMLIPPTNDTTNALGGSYKVYVKSTATAVTITWKTAWAGEFEKDVQAVLFSNGDIRFSYKTLVNQTGSVLVSNGARAYYSSASRTLLGSATDPSGDAPAEVDATFRSQIDVVSLGLSRVAGTKLLEIAIDVASAPNRAGFPGDAALTLMLDFGTTNSEREVNRYWIDVRSATISYTPPGSGSSTDGGQVSVSGATIKVLLKEEDLALSSRNTTLNAWVVWGPAWQGDSGAATVALGAVGTNLGKDFSTLTTTTQQLTEPLFEQFTFPVVNVSAVWSRLKSVYGLTDNDTDLVSIYQNYLTDLIFYAGGYAAGGNHGDGGVDVNDRTARPFAPTLLHVDRLGRGWNASANGILSLLLHEFGHRWLYFVRIMEDGVATSSLNPDGGHPRGGVHLPAAFPVLGTFDVSAMGGAYFTKVEGTANYTTPAEMANVGLSWNELYLMGLAAPSEVAPWFYLTGPGLDAPYNAASGTTFTPTSRKDVNLQQMIDAIGARTPVYPAAKKAFRNVYVILERTSDPVSSPTIASFRTNYVNAFATRLAAITGGRASVSYLPNGFAEPVAAPTGVTATATGATTVSVTWNAVTGATGYQIFRSASGTGGFAQVGTSTSASYSDTAAANTAYLYRVRATNGGTASADSAHDLATTVVFTDATLTAGTSAIKAVHFTEIRTAVNAVRALAGLAAGSYTDPSLGVGTTMKAAHVAEPRSLLDAARAALSLSTLTYTDATLSAGTTVAKAVHVTEIRAGTQ